METEITRLELLSSLFYAGGEEAGWEAAGCEAADPFGCAEGSGEKLFCFELDKDEALRFEPDREILLGKGAPARELPKGNYLFAQKREILGREAIIGLAAEIQSEGLWQRLLPGKVLYVRYLFEDGRPVTQLFRPYPKSPAGSG